MQAKAVGLDKKADIVLFYIGLDEISNSESLNRVHMEQHTLLYGGALPKN